MVVMMVPRGRCNRRRARVPRANRVLARRCAGKSGRQAQDALLQRELVVDPGHRQVPAPAALDVAKTVPCLECGTGEEGRDVRVRKADRTEGLDEGVLIADPGEGKVDATKREPVQLQLPLLKVPEGCSVVERHGIEVISEGHYSFT